MGEVACLRCGLEQRIQACRDRELENIRRERDALRAQLAHAHALLLRVKEALDVAIGAVPEEPEA